jgi:hypothetical protein
MQLDGTCMNSLQVTIGGDRFDRLLILTVLPPQPGEGPRGAVGIADGHAVGPRQLSRDARARASEAADRSEFGGDAHACSDRDG